MHLYAKVLIRRYFSEGACRSVRAINRTGDQTAPIKSSNIAFCFSKWFDWKVNFFKYPFYSFKSSPNSIILPQKPAAWEQWVSASGAFRRR